MATISTSQTLDSAARSAGEAMTINSSAILTIDTHTRYHANAPASGTGSLGSFTMTAASGGQCFLDGTKMRMIAYGSGTGNVPAYNTSVTQGGVTGVLMCVISALNAAPTAVGAAMPASGFIMFKSVSGGSFSAGALSGIGATAVGSEQAGFIEVVVDDAATFTIGRAQTFKTRMQWFYPFDTSGNLVTTSGSRGQQIQLPNFGGTNCYYPGVWIETSSGSNTYEFWPAALAGTGSPWATTALGTDARSKFVQCLSGGIIRIGSDGTNNIGDLPGSGRKIRIPNVIVKSCATGSRASDSVPSGTLATRPDFTVTNAGVLDVEGLIGHWYMALGQAYAVKLWYVALFDQFSITECATALDLKEVGNGNYNNGDVNAMILTSNFAGGTLVDCKMGRSGTIAATDYGWNVTNCFYLTFTRCHFQNRTFRTATSSHPFYASLCKGLTFNDCVAVGASIYLNSCVDTVLNDTQYADSYHTTSSSTAVPVGVIQVMAGCLNTVIDGLSWFTSVANVHPDASLLYLSAARGIKIRNIGTFASPLSAGSSNAMLNCINDAGNSADVQIKRVYMDLLATTFCNMVNSTKNVLIENCSDSAGASTTRNLVCAALNLRVKSSRFASLAPASTASIYGSIFYDHYTSTSAGRLGLKFHEPTAEYTAYVTTSFSSSSTGTSGYTSAGGLALVNSGDYAIYEWPHWIKGIDSFQNSAPTITTATNMTVEYQIDTGSGWNGTWKTFNASNLSGETLNTDPGFRIKIRCTANATSASNSLTELYALTNAATTTQDNLYTLDPVTIKVTVKDAATGAVVEGQRVYLLATGSGPYSDGTVLLNAITDSNGVAQDTSHAYLGTQQVSGKARRGSSTPFYKTTTVAGTILSTGMDITIFAVKDE